MSKTFVEYADGTVRVGGSLLHTVHKKGLTAAEVVVLRAEHGHDAVIDLKFAGTKTRDAYPYNAEELDRLQQKGYAQKLLSECWPGHNPQLPTKFSDIGIKLNKSAGLTPREQADADAEEERLAAEKEAEEMERLMGGGDADED